MACNLSRAQLAFFCSALAGMAGVVGCGSDPQAAEPSGSAGSSAGSGAGGSGAGGTGVAGTAASAGSSGAGQLAAGAGGSGEEVCENIITEYPPPSAEHVTACSALSYDSNPPAGGNHYAIWAAFQSYDFALPAGFLVHALEHGAIVYWYNCADGCADEVARAQAMIDALPVDPLCSGTSSQRRVILAPSPDLDVRWAASSWGYVIKSSCFDPAALRTFYMDHFGRGPEALCNDGQAFTGNPCP
ncbi:MAG: hypothetical protein RL033_2569 [Pseudomonadota bacterium]